MGSLKMVIPAGSALGLRALLTRAMLCSGRRHIALATFCLSLLLPLASAQQIKFRPQISIAYPLTYDPWKLSIFRGTMEKVTGWTIRWLELRDAHKATTAMSNGECSMAVVDSADLALATTRGANWRAIWVMEDLNLQEALIVHNQF